MNRDLRRLQKLAGIINESYDEASMQADMDYEAGGGREMEGEMEGGSGELTPEVMAQLDPIKQEIAEIAAECGCDLGTICDYLCEKSDDEMEGDDMEAEMSDEMEGEERF